MEAAVFAKMLVVMNQTTPHHNQQGNLDTHHDKNVKSYCSYTSARHCTVLKLLKFVFTQYMDLFSQKIDESA